MAHQVEREKKVSFVICCSSKTRVPAGTVGRGFCQAFSFLQEEEKKNKKPDLISSSLAHQKVIRLFIPFPFRERRREGFLPAGLGNLPKRRLD